MVLSLSLSRSLCSGRRIFLTVVRFLRDPLLPPPKKNKTEQKKRGKKNEDLQLRKWYRLERELYVYFRNFIARASKPPPPPRTIILIGFYEKNSTKQIIRFFFFSLCYRRHPAGNIVFARHHAVRGHVRTNGTRAHIHDPRVRRGMQRRHQFGDHSHHIAGSVRHVLR